MLDAQGAEVIEIPTIKRAPIRETPLLREILAPLPLVNTWFAFTSPHGVAVFFEKLAEYRLDIRALVGCRFAAIGNATCAALASRGLIPDLAPEVFSGAALGAALAKTVAPEERVILPRSAAGGTEILQALEAAGLCYTDVPIYDTLPETGYENPVFRDRLTQGLDYIAFTSPSTVKGFVRIFGEPRAASPIALCIGEATAGSARAYGMKVLVPAVSSLEGMIETLLMSRNSYSSTP
jgi:uroporphyrinogen III methyltransferase/synthase